MWRDSFLFLGGEGGRGLGVLMLLKGVSYGPTLKALVGNLHGHTKTHGISVSTAV